MSAQRILLLLLGPFVIVAGCYWLTMPDRDRRLAAAVESVAEPHGPASGSPSAKEEPALEMACELAAAQVGPKLAAGCRVLIRPPFVLAGDLPASALQAHYEQTILPTARALSTCYFDHPPDAPVTILMFASDRSYQAHAARLDGRRQAAYYGYYLKSDRRAVLNASTGSGTLAHELTHALAHFDFPEMPEWFDEGLASLHEESAFSDDQLRLLGRSNWRISYLVQAIRNDRLRPLEALCSGQTRRGEEEAVDYAHARYLCLYLQRRHLLGPFYRKFRTNVATDPTGLDSLCEVLQVDSPEEIDRDFRRWVIEVYESEH